MFNRKKKILYPNCARLHDLYNRQGVDNGICMTRMFAANTLSYGIVFVFTKIQNDTSHYSRRVCVCATRIKTPHGNDV